MEKLVDQDRLERWISRRKLGPAVAERVRSLNKVTTEGQVPRGFHPAPTLWGKCWAMELVSKRQFIDTHGREAFEALPASEKIRDGKRLYVRAEAYYDLPRTDRPY